MKKFLTIMLLSLVLPVAAAASDLALPVTVQTFQGVRFYNGGVGLEERGRMPQIYPLKIVLATDRGLYLNDAEVVVSGSEGREVLRVRAGNGPWLVADVPPGVYSVKATLEGRTAGATVQVEAGRRKVVVLSWKTAEVDMGL